MKTGQKERFTKLAFRKVIKHFFIFIAAGIVMIFGINGFIRISVEKQIVTYSWIMRDFPHTRACIGQRKFSRQINLL